MTTGVGEHSAPSGVFERWNDTEPLRLYLYGITVPVLGVCVVYGWLSTEQLGAWLAVAGAVFLAAGLGGELARRQVTSPATLELDLDEQHRKSYARGVEDALHRTPDVVTTEVRQVRTPERCRYIESGNRCVLPAHGKETPHHYG